MHRKLPALAVLAVAIAVPAQAVAVTPSATSSGSGGAVARQVQVPATDPAVPEVAGEKAQLTDDGLAIAPASAPQEIKDLIAAGNKIAKLPYKYGGGHAKVADSGYDCSGSISYALLKAGLLDSPLDSSSFMKWGDRGRGTWITIRSNPGHAYMMVAGLRFDTSAAKVGGSRWTDEKRSAKGYRGTHPEGF